jgi:hypothetical protein
LWFADVLLYFLDKHAYIPEVVGPTGEKGIWIAADGRADILMRCDWPIDHLSLRIESPIRTLVTISAGSRESSVTIVPGTPSTFDLPTSGIHDQYGYAYLLRARSSDGFVPHLQNPSSTDSRNLGALMRFKAVPAGSHR